MNAQTNAQAQNDQSQQLPLFYSNIVPLDKEKHAKTSLEKEISYGFAANINAVPINIIELPHVMQFYPIAFSPNDPATPLAILGLKNGQNLFVDKKGRWAEGTYVPAYVRRYPFLLARAGQNGENMLLCMDDVKGVTVAKGGKNPLFKDGEPTDLVKNALEFCKSYQSAANQTMEFSETLSKTDILMERTADIRLPEGERLTLSGFRVVDEKKFNALDDATILQWHNKRWLRFVYAHLLSAGNWQRLYQRMQEAA